MKARVPRPVAFIHSRATRHTSLERATSASKTRRELREARPSAIAPSISRSPKHRGAAFDISSRRRARIDCSRRRSWRREVLWVALANGGWVSRRPRVSCRRIAGNLPASTCHERQHPKHRHHLAGRRYLRIPRLPHHALRAPGIPWGGSRQRKDQVASARRARAHTNAHTNARAEPARGPEMTRGGSGPGPPSRASAL